MSNSGLDGAAATNGESPAAQRKHTAITLCNETNIVRIYLLVPTLYRTHVLGSALAGEPQLRGWQEQWRHLLGRTNTHDTGEMLHRQ